MASAYSPECFSALPSLREAGVSFSVKDARACLEGPIRDLFINSKVQASYGVALLHRHFSVQPTQRLVEYHKTATAWDAENSAASVFPKYDGLVVPRSYLFDEWGVARPYEFKFMAGQETRPISDIGDSKALEFFSAFHALLLQHDLEKIFGLRSLDGYDPALSVEVTEGTANIMLPPTAISSDGLIEAMWTFDDVTGKCHCREYCFKLSGGAHEENHGCS